MTSHFLNIEENGPQSIEEGWVGQEVSDETGEVEEPTPHHTHSLEPNFLPAITC